MFGQSSSLARSGRYEALVLGHVVQTWKGAFVISAERSSSLERRGQVLLIPQLVLPFGASNACLIAENAMRCDPWSVHSGDLTPM